ncbi:hypothetical protein [Bacillus litorisediminis]|uniref:hypothetical protein n=1 Tax=Bacillus litorisediminis TaxID=2922713 RepID=UPI001FAE6222|nr:hypothetical protein [Bacillus litorisediminis]
MTIQHIYLEAKEHGFKSLVLLIEYLVEERKVLKFTDPEEKLTYYLQDRFRNKMNEYLREYEVKRNG